MLNNPSSKVIEQMDYYIKRVEEESDYLKISSPEEIKVCDPACGSGHMLTYAYDLLYAIYLDAGYDPVDIPELILTKNLFGIEIDERAAELAAFALSMKALKGNPNDDSNNRRRFFRNPIKPNICRLESIAFDDGELDEYIEFVGRDLFTQDLRATLKEFEEADNFGSLIQPTLKNPEDVKAALEAKDVSGQLFLTETHKRVLRAVDQADYLSQKYHVVVANPPYLGSKGMNPRLNTWIKGIYKDSKRDLYSAFLERAVELAKAQGTTAMITMQSWMFLSSFEKLRIKLLKVSYLSSMAHLGTRAFDTIGGEVVSTTAFTIIKSPDEYRKGSYLRLVEGKSEQEKKQAFKDSIDKKNNVKIYHSSSSDFKKIPGLPLAYWVSDKVRNIFELESSLGDVIDAKQGIGSGDDDYFFRFFWEPNWRNVGLNYESAELGWNDGKRYFPLNKGGSFRKWDGNKEYVISFDKNSRDMLKKMGNHLPSEDRYFKPFISWSDITTETNSFRYYERGFLFSNTGHCAFPVSEMQRNILLAYLNNKFVNMMTKILNPTIHFHVGYFNLLPYPRRLEKHSEKIKLLVDRARDISNQDWDLKEVSWGFKGSPLMSFTENGSIEKGIEKFQVYLGSLIDEMLEIEGALNALFINEYELEGEVDTYIPKSEISLSLNKDFRYGISKSDNDKDKLFLADTLRDFISFSVGCMLGRYALNTDGLVMASQGETLEDYLRKVPHSSFIPDDDNVIPMIDFEGDWFEDDISERFKEFLKVTFGEENFAENLTFIEEAIGKDIKKYFVKDFYTDHVKRYKKRPIYWLFSSPKGTFNALIYMHRYRSDTVSVVLNDYLREFRTKLQARKESYEQVEVSASSSQKEKTQAIKAIDKINKVLDEVNDYERDILYPLAGQNIEIDLDDGVKANYPKFGKALKKIAGLS